MTCVIHTQTPIGPLTIYGNDQHITHIRFGTHDTPTAPTSILTMCKTQIDEYFGHTRTQFDLPLATSGSQFQEATWNHLLSIPYGATQTYKELAISMNNPNASRAVGNACNKNPLPIIIPCHRVLGSNQTLTGYAGGLDKKQLLLTHEASILKQA